MNIINIKEKIKDMENRFLKVPITNAPLLVLDKKTFTAGPADAFDDEGNPRLPFPYFRFSLEKQENNGVGVRMYGFVSTDWIESTVGIRAFVCVTHGGKEHIISMWYGRKMSDLVNNTITIVANFRLPNGQKEKTNSPDGDMALAQIVSDLICCFTQGIMQPVSVHPPADKSVGKSKEWVQAREYYTVVHRKHAANRKEVKAGSCIKDNSDTLTAHSRRAHERILRSPRWGKSQGRRLWVRACWVGPKEWIDAESKQIYRVL